jgi:hypothetical protein
LRTLRRRRNCVRTLWRTHRNVTWRMGSVELRLEQFFTGRHAKKHVVHVINILRIIFLNTHNGNAY